MHNKWISDLENLGLPWLLEVRRVRMDQDLLPEL